MAFKYNATGNSTALRRINDTLAAFDLLTKCTGKDGFLARIAEPSNSKPYQAYYNGSNHAFSCVAPWQDYTWYVSAHMC